MSHDSRAPRSTRFIPRITWKTNIKASCIRNFIEIVVGLGLKKRLWKLVSLPVRDPSDPSGEEIPPFPQGKSIPRGITEGFPQEIKESKNHSHLTQV